MLSATPNEKWTRDAVDRVVRDAIVQESNGELTREMCTDDAPLGAGGLGIGSLSFVGVVIALEQALSIRFDDEILMKTEVATLGEFVDLVFGLWRRSSGES
jgi:acyl carrier protein